MSVTPSTGTVSVLFPQQPADTQDLVTFGRLVTDSPAAKLWMGQSLRIESHPALAYLAGAGCHIPIGIAVGLIVLRHPFDAALQARALAALMEHPVTIGYGAAEPNFVRSLRGSPYDKPATAVEEYVSVMRALLRGQRVEHQGRLFTVNQALPPLEHPPVEVGTGVLREGMARATGRSADAALTWLTPPAYIRDTLIPALETGARGRQPRPRVVTMVQATIDRPGRNPTMLAQHGAYNHLRMPHYTDMLRRAGIDVDLSDPASGARELAEEGIYVYGKAGDVAAGIREYHDAGVDEVILNLAAVSNLYGTAEVMRDLEQILEEFQ